jgi:hypothetical protein
MLPSRFEYHRPDSLEEALHLLAEHGDEAKVLAGGQRPGAVRGGRSGVAEIRDTRRVDAVATGGGGDRWMRRRPATGPCPTRTS